MYIIYVHVCMCIKYWFMLFASFVPLQTYNIIIVLYNSSLKGTILLLVRYPFR